MMITDELAARLAEEGMTAEAIARALELGRADGSLLADDDGTIVTHARLENITLWVRYREHDGDIEVIDAYYHRMQVG